MKKKETVKKKTEIVSSDNHGGSRAGAGRPISENRKNFRGLKVRDSDWELIALNASKKGLSIGDYFVYLNTGKPPQD